MNPTRYEIEFRVGLGWQPLAKATCLAFARDIVAALPTGNVYRLIEVTELRKEVPLTNE